MVSRLPYLPGLLAGANPESGFPTHTAFKGGATLEPKAAPHRTQNRGDLPSLPSLGSVPSSFLGWLFPALIRPQRVSSPVCLPAPLSEGSPRILPASVWSSLPPLLMALWPPVYSVCVKQSMFTHLHLNYEEMAGVRWGEAVGRNRGTCRPTTLSCVRYQEGNTALVKSSGL